MVPEDRPLPDCSVCEETGHREDACDVLWRTFDPSTAELRKVKKLPMSCYNCGSNLHYGAECKLKPSKNHHRSIAKTFSMENASQYIDESATDLAISLLASKYPQGPLRRREPKGKERDQEQSDDDPERFIRPKVARDDGQGSHIRIGNGKGRRSKRGKRSDEKPQEMAIDTYPPPPAAQGQGNSFNHSGERPPLPPQDASFSSYRHDPRPRQDSYHPPHGDSWRPPLPAGPPPTSQFPPKDTRPREQRLHLYQPMPSAGKNAWKKHRT